MIRYHGGPITPYSAALACWRGSHAMISFAHPDQLPLAAEVAHSFVLDNGAFSAWKSNTPVDWKEYARWCASWCRHPGFDWCLIPDVIDGSPEENDELIRSFGTWFGNASKIWPEHLLHLQVPVWHLHEPVSRLERLVKDWPKVALGSSGEFSQIGTARWWSRMAEAMQVACDEEGWPKAKLHGLRQMDPTVFSQIPYSFVDSTMVARNIGIDSAWKGTYLPPTKEVRAMVLRERIETHASCARWSGSIGIQNNLELIG